MTVFMTHPDEIKIERVNETASIVYKRDLEDLHVTFKSMDQLKECARQLDDFIKEQEK